MAIATENEVNIRPAGTRVGVSGIVRKEPTVGKWYVLVQQFGDGSDPDDSERHGDRVRYDGNGCWSIADGSEADMDDYDYLQEQR